MESTKDKSKTGNLNWGFNILEIEYIINTYKKNSRKGSYAVS